MTMNRTNPSNPTTATNRLRPAIPCYSPDGTSLGPRTLAAAQRLVADGYVRPVYGRKGHLRAIWLLCDDGSNPIPSRAPSGTRYSFIETLENGRCWQLRRLHHREPLELRGEEGLAANPRDPFLQVVRDCMVPLPTASPKAAPPPAKPATVTLPTAKPSTTTSVAAQPGPAPVDPSASIGACAIPSVPAVQVT